jgi:hypothetical protein
MLLVSTSRPGTGACPTLDVLLDAVLIDFELGGALTDELCSREGF